MYSVKAKYSLKSTRRPDIDHDGLSLIKPSFSDRTILSLGQIALNVVLRLPPHTLDHMTIDKLLKAF